MSERLTQALLDAGKPYGFFVKFDWMGTLHRYWSGFGDFDWQEPGEDSASVWVGCGFLGKIILPQRSGEVEVSEVIFELSGVDEGLRSNINDDIRGGAFSVWHVFINRQYQAEVHSVLSEGVLDRAEWNETGSTSTIRVIGRGDFPFLETQEIKRWTPEEQRAHLVELGLEPDSDTGFDVMHKQRDNSIAWLPG